MNLQKTLLIISCALVLHLPAAAQDNLFDVDGAIKIGDSQHPDPEPGTIRWTGSIFEGYNGVKWVPLSPINHTGEVKDTCGNTYLTVKIGSQTWMAENLRTHKYQDGSIIPQILSYSQWQNLNTGAWSWYDLDSAFEVTYGKLYNWYAVTDSSGLCPTNWHVPSFDDWKILEDYATAASCAGLQGNLKEAGFDHWNPPNGQATDETGFTGLPGGVRQVAGDFEDLGEIGKWWSSTQLFSSSAWSAKLNRSDGELFLYDESFKRGFSVRCIKDKN